MTVDVHDGLNEIRNHSHLSYEDVDILAPIVILLEDIRSGKAKEDSLDMRVAQLIGLFDINENKSAEQGQRRSAQFVIECLLGLHPDKEMEIWGLVREQAEHHRISIYPAEFEIISRLNVDTAGFFLLALLISLDQEINKVSIAFTIDNGKTRIRLYRGQSADDMIQLVSIATGDVILSREEITTPPLPETIVSCLPGKKIDEIIDSTYLNGLNITVRDVSQSDAQTSIKIDYNQSIEYLHRIAKSQIERLMWP